MVKYMFLDKLEWINLMVKELCLFLFFLNLKYEITI